MKAYINGTLPFTEEITDKNNIIKIMGKIKQGEFLTQEEAEELLKFINCNARKKLAKKTWRDLDSDFEGFCGTSQVISMGLYKEMGLSVKYCNARNFDGTNRRASHAFGIVYIPIGNEIKPYLIDLTFKQFCTCEKCDVERYNEKSLPYGIPAAPHPGYFLNQTEEGRSIIEQLLGVGFVQLTPEVAKLYGDSFVLSTRDLKFYNGIIPHEYTTEYISEDYLKSMQIPDEADMYDELRWD